MKATALLGIYLISQSLTWASCPGAKGEALKTCNCYEIQDILDEKFMLCEKDSDCILLPDMCGGLAGINKKYRAELSDKWKNPILKQRLNPNDFLVTCHEIKRCWSSKKK